MGKKKKSIFLESLENRRNKINCTIRSPIDNTGVVFLHRCMCLHIALKKAIMEPFSIKIKLDLMGNKHITPEDQTCFFPPHNFILCGLLCLWTWLMFSENRTDKKWFIVKENNDSKMMCLVWNQLLMNKTSSEQKPTCAQQLSQQIGLWKQWLCLLYFTSQSFNLFAFWRVINWISSND